VYRLFALLGISLVAFAADFTIHHVTAAGGDLKRMQAALVAVGLRSEPRAASAQDAVETAVVNFPDGSYLELIAPRPGAVVAHVWSKAMRGEAGPCAWAAYVKGAAPSGAIFPLPVSQPPQRNRQPTTKDFGGVTRVVIAVRDLEASVKRYRQAYDLPAPIRQMDSDFGARLALLGGTPVILAAPVAADSWLHGRLEQLGEGPCAFVLSLRRGRYKPAFKTRWFGADISWFDNDKLGWALGFE
jgi:hypothetical protein